MCRFGKGEGSAAAELQGDMGLVKERPWRAASLLLLRGEDQLLGLGVDSFNFVF